MDKLVGWIDVLSSGHLPFLAAKGLHLGDLVVAMGFLTMADWEGDGKSHNETRLNALYLEVLKRDNHTLR